MNSLQMKGESHVAQQGLQGGNKYYVGKAFGKGATSDQSQIK